MQLVGSVVELMLGEWGDGDGLLAVGAERDGADDGRHGWRIAGESREEEEERMKEEEKRGRG